MNNKILFTAVAMYLWLMMFVSYTFLTRLAGARFEGKQINLFNFLHNNIPQLTSHAYVLWGSAAE